MESYFLKRLITFIPVCFLLIAFAFILTLAIPGNAIDSLLIRDEGISVSSTDYQIRKEKLAHKLGLDKPVFYFSVASLAEINATDYFANAKEESTFRKLLNTNGDYLYVKKYFACVKEFDKRLSDLSQNKNTFSNELLNKITSAQLLARSLKTESNPETIQEKITLIENSLSETHGLSNITSFLKVSFGEMQNNSCAWKTFIPAISFNSRNQFHDWFFGSENSKGIIRGDFGKSYLTGKPVTTIIKEKIAWSLVFSAGSILLAYIISIPLATFLVYKKSETLNSVSDAMLSFFYATPVYLMGVLLIFIFSNPDIINAFPSSGVKPTGGFLPGTTFIHKFFITIPYLVLPLICYTYSTFSFLTRTLQSLLNEQMKSDYIRTARAKGMNEYKIVLNHALRNSLLPLVAVFANLFPMMLGGSVILESMFTIPGMGLETYMAVHNRNYPIVIAVFTISGLLTITGYLITDFIYSKIDPRIAFDKK